MPSRAGSPSERTARPNSASPSSSSLTTIVSPGSLPAEVEEEHHARQDEERLPPGREERARHPPVRVRGLPEARDVALEPGEVLEVGRRRQEDGVEPRLVESHGESLAPGGELGGRQRLVRHGARRSSRSRIAPRARSRAAFVAEEDVGDVGAEQERVELEEDLRGIDGGVELPQLLRATDLRAEVVHELGVHRAEVISDRPGLGVELDRRGDEEAATGEHAPLEVSEEGVAERVDPSQSLGRLERSFRHLAVVDLAGGLDRGVLQLLLRAKVREDAALAHADVLGEPADGETLQALDRRELGRRGEDRRAAALAVGPQPTAVIAESGASRTDKLARPVVLSLAIRPIVLSRRHPS